MLGVKNYLVVISRMFFVSYDLGLLKNNRTFDCHYFIKKLIYKGDHIIDIGANLGYYSRLFAKLAGPEGKVLSVEPVTLFRKILKFNTSRYKNTTIVPFALGSEDNKEILMGIPKSNKYLRHGLTRVLENSENEPFEFTFTEKMFTPLSLFGNIEKCDYIKCDVEGYESHIVPQLGFILNKFHPVIQIEMEPENRRSIIKYLATFTYSAFYLEREFLLPVGNEPETIYGDFFFVPKDRMKIAAPYFKKI